MSTRPHSWLWRRSMAFGVAGFSMFMLLWLAQNGVQDGALHNLIAAGCMYLLGGVFAVYVAGATIDDLVSLVKGVRGIPDEKK